ncbi:hypothetical protein BH23ACT6_BH23ACT6_24710 [soil metagenome]
MTSLPQTTATAGRAANSERAATSARAATSECAATSARAATSRPAHNRHRSPRRLIAAALVVGVLSFIVAALGIGVRAADVGTAAVDEPQYLLTAISLAEDGNLDISDERAQGRDVEFHDGVLPVQTSVLEGGARISPHDPGLPMMLAPAMVLASDVGLPGWVGAKLLVAMLAGVLAAATTWVLGTRWEVPPGWAAGVAAAAGMSSPLAVYGHQVYPELPAAVAAVISVAAIIPRRDRPAAGQASELDSRIVSRQPWSAGRVIVLVLAISALPWLSIKYAPVAAALAVVALLRIWRSNPRTAVSALGALGASGLLWIFAHHLLYGGWTAYATGDHFEDTGEFSVVGVSPSYLSRSTRLIGLLIDRDYGIAAWQPAWLLVLPALGLLWGLARGHRQAGESDPQRGHQHNDQLGPARHNPGGASSGLYLDVLLVPLAAGLLTATFAALTMHGFWWPGRQLVVVLPLAVMVIAIAGSQLTASKVRALDDPQTAGMPQPRSRATRAPSLRGRGRGPWQPRVGGSWRRWVVGVTVALGLAGVGIHAWTVLAGYAGTLTWVGAPDLAPPQAVAIMRSVLPDYRELGPNDWALHIGWVLAAAVLLALGRFLGISMTDAAVSLDSTATPHPAAPYPTAQHASAPDQTAPHPDTPHLAEPHAAEPHAAAPRTTKDVTTR